LQIAFGFLSSRRNVDLIRCRGRPSAVVVARLIALNAALTARTNFRNLKSDRIALTS
jgi:hypothetical protein